MTDVDLGSLGLEHANAMLEWMLDDEVRANVGVRATPSLEATEAWIARAISDEAIEARAILLHGRHVGNVVLDQIDRYAKKARLSIYIGDSTARGRGVGREAMQLILDVAFRQLDLIKVSLTVHVRNAPAIALYLATGFVIEGVHRDEFMLRGERISELYMGILRADYRRSAAPRRPSSDPP